MERELAWPYLSDALPGRPLSEYALRCVSATLGATAVAHLAGAPVWAGCLGGLAVFAVFPSYQFRIKKLKDAPRWVAEESYRERVPEPTFVWQLAILVGLTLLTRSQDSWFVVLLWAPLVAYRMGSRLWTELDLESGQVSHHRTFCGLQITRAGPHLSQARAVISGRPVARAGEQPSYSVAIRMGTGSLIHIQGSQSVAASHQAGRRLAHKLDLPHHPVPLNGDLDEARCEDPWEDVPGLPRTGQRGSLPP